MKTLISIFIVLSLTACAEQTIKNDSPIQEPDTVFPSTYLPRGSADFAIVNTTILTGNGEQLSRASVVISNGRIQAIGRNVVIPEGVRTIDGQGKWLTPGLIDVHSHLGVYPSPSHEGNEDGNEMTSPNTAEVWAEHSVWTQDPQFTLSLAGGITSMQILPGSANLFGGRSVTVKNVPARSVQEMKFPGAPYGLKMACGENPKRVYGERKQLPSTRMGNVAGYRQAWIEAEEYRKAMDNHAENDGQDKEGKPPKRNLQNETLAEVLRGNILVHNHCYRAEEMLVMLDIAKEFNYKITAFHHAVEAYKVADILADNHVCAAVWPEWWGFKHEAYDMVEENAAMVHAANACAIVHSDSAITTQHLNQEAAKIMAAANKAGYNIERAQAIKWITSNPAQAMGISEHTGSIEVGKMADLVLWDGDPFSVYTKTENVFIDGVLMYDRNDKSRQPVTDFDLGILDPQGERL